MLVVAEDGKRREVIAHQVAAGLLKQRQTASEPVELLREGLAEEGP
jgi:hypothetical protein